MPFLINDTVDRFAKSYAIQFTHAFLSGAVVKSSGYLLRNVHHPGVVVREPRPTSEQSRFVGCFHCNLAVQVDDHHFVFRRVHPEGGVPQRIHWGVAIHHVHISLHGHLRIGGVPRSLKMGSTTFAFHERSFSTRIGYTEKLSLTELSISRGTSLTDRLMQQLIRHEAGCLDPHTDTLHIEAIRASLSLTNGRERRFILQANKSLVFTAFEIDLGNSEY